MPIIPAELKLYRSATVSNEGANGGRLSANEVPDATAQSVFPRITQDQRTAGHTDYRKLFWKIANDDDLIAYDVQVWLDKLAPGGDRVLIWEGTQRDTQADVIATPPSRYYGSGLLDLDVNSGLFVLDANVEDATDAIFVAGDLVYITDGTNEEFITIAAGGVAWAGNVATLTFTSALLFSYTVALATRVSPVIESGDIETTLDNWAENTAIGTYDETTYPVDLDNIGSIEQTWTITFNDASAFTLSGDILGVVDTGNIGTNFSPINSDFAKPYFTIDKDGWGGTWAVGETLVFQTHPAVVPLWSKRITPPGTPSYTGDGVTYAISGESS